jgi:hypothetical protein
MMRAVVLTLQTAMVIFLKAMIIVFKKTNYYFPMVSTIATATLLCHQFGVLRPLGVCMWIYEI